MSMFDHVDLFLVVFDSLSLRHTNPTETFTLSEGHSTLSRNVPVASGGLDEIFNLPPHENCIIRVPGAVSTRLCPLRLL